MATIRQEIFINAKPEDVYAAFVDPKIHSAFTGAVATLDKKKFSAWDGYIFGRNIKLVKGKKIVQEWQTTEWPKEAEPSIFELTFLASKGGTLVKMVHSKVPAGQADEYAKGWEDFYWKPLKKYFKKS